MNRERYSIQHIAAAVQQHALGTLLADIATKLGIPGQTSHRGKKGYGGLEPGQACELGQLREENATQKKIVGDWIPDNSMLTDIKKR